MVQLTCTMVTLIDHNDVKRTNKVVIHFTFYCCRSGVVCCMADVVAPSLLEKLQYLPSPGTRKRIKENFSLGMEDWDSDDSDFQPLARAKRKCHGDSPKRFAEPTSAEALESTSKGVVPKNTQKKRRVGSTSSE